MRGRYYAVRSANRLSVRLYVRSSFFMSAYQSMLCMSGACIRDCIAVCEAYTQPISTNRASLKEEVIALFHGGTCLVTIVSSWARWACCGVMVSFLLSVCLKAGFHSKIDMFCFLFFNILVINSIQRLRQR